MAVDVHTASQARAQLVRRQADVSRVIDGEALAMFGLFGLSWAVPAAAVRLGNAASTLLRRRLHRASH
jgi:hypothetical protein